MSVQCAGLPPLQFPFLFFLRVSVRTEPSRHIYIFIETQRGFACKPAGRLADGRDTKTRGRYYYMERKWYLCAS
jgi:hypothetical protein